MGTKVIIDAGITEVNDVPKYSLYGHCTASGSLPDESIFLLEIVDPDAPEDDLLYRVAQISDLVVAVGYGKNRDQAIRDGVSYWRSAQFANYYTDVEVAARAKQVFQDEVNKLVSDYATYSDQFVAFSVEVEFPNSTVAATDALKAAYDTTLAAYNTARDTQEAADETLLNAQTTLDDTETWYERRLNLEASLDVRVAEVNHAEALYNIFLGTGVASDADWVIAQIESFIGAYDSWGSGVDPQRNSLEDDKNNFSAQRTKALSADISVIASYVTNLSNLKADIVTLYIPYSQANVTMATSAVTTAQTAKITADADVTARYAAVEAAYDAAKAVCPDWTPDTPLPAQP